MQFPRCPLSPVPHRWRQFDIQIIKSFNDLIAIHKSTINSVIVDSDSICPRSKQTVCEETNYANCQPVEINNKYFRVVNSNDIFPYFFCVVYFFFFRLFLFFFFFEMKTVSKEIKFEIRIKEETLRNRCNVR